jgi:hypothetical protein
VQHDLAVAAGPGSPTGLDLRTGRRHEHEGEVVQPIEEVVDGVEDQLVRPVEL